MFRLTDFADSHCGLHCTLCEHKTEGKCQGCMETGGSAGARGQCPIAACCESKGLEHCGQCGDIPCALLAELSSADVPKGARIEQCKRWQRVSLRNASVV